MIKLEIDTINTYGAEGYAYDTQFTDAQLAKLGFERGTEYQEEIQIEVDFTVKWSGEVPLVYVNGVYALDRAGNESLCLDEDMVDYGLLAEHIEENGPVLSWMRAYQAYVADRHVSVEEY